MLKVLLSIPHGGTEVPEELGDRVCLTHRDLFDDSDPFTAEIYDLAGDVAGVVKARIARAYVDLNRAPAERPPQSPDGVVKAATCLKRPIYRPGREPGQALTERLLRRYHAPYHAELAAAAARPGLKLALDCHSMLPVGPPVSRDVGRPRPVFCLSNREGVTAPGDLLVELAGALARAFEVPPSLIGLNDPFKGGYIITRHGVGPVPWIQVEMNRCLYLEEPWFHQANLSVSPERIAQLRACFLDALRSLRLP